MQNAVFATQDNSGEEGSIASVPTPVGYNLVGAYESITTSQSIPGWFVSTNAGATWTTRHVDDPTFGWAHPATLTGGAWSSFWRRPSIIATTRTNEAVALTVARTSTVPCGGSTFKSDIVLNTSSDGGSTFNNTFVVSDASSFGDCGVSLSDPVMAPDVAVGSDDVWVMWNRSSGCGPFLRRIHIGPTITADPIVNLANKFSPANICLMGNYALTVRHTTQDSSPLLAVAFPNYNANTWANSTNNCSTTPQPPPQPVTWFFGTSSDLGNTWGPLTGHHQAPIVTDATWPRCYGTTYSSTNQDRPTLAYDAQSGYFVVTLTKSELYPNNASAGMHVEVFRSLGGTTWNSWKALCGSMIDPITGQPVQIINGAIPQTDPFCFQYGSSLGVGNWGGYHAAFTWYSTTGAGGNQPVTLQGASFDPAQYMNYGTVSQVSVGLGVPWVEGTTGLPATAFEPAWGLHNGVTSPMPGMFNAVWTDWRATNGLGTPVPNISATSFNP